MTEPPSTVPVCYRHATRETYVRCSRCNRPICPDCMRDAAVGHQCPECVAEGRRTQRPVRTAFGGGAAGREGYVTKALLALNVVVAVIGAAIAGGGALVGGGLFTGITKLQAWGAVVGPSVTVAPEGIAYGSFPEFGTVYTGVYDGGIYRMFTAMFIHYGILHLGLNMWGLWVLGRDLEMVLGPLRFLALYLIAGLGGNVAALLLSPNSFSAGASTAIYGLLAAYFIVLRRLGRDTSAIVGVLVINLVLSFGIARISWQGHLGGLVTGGLVAAILAYAPRGNRTLVQVIGSTAVFVFLIGLTLARVFTS